MWFDGETVLSCPGIVGRLGDTRRAPVYTLKARHSAIQCGRFETSSSEHCFAIQHIGSVCVCV